MSQCEHQPSIEDEELGKVIAVETHSVFVERLSLEGCKNCAMHGLCGSKSNPQLKFPNDQDFKTGDIVSIEIQSSTRIMSSLMIFILPILVMILFFCLARYLIDLSENMSILISFSSLILSALIVWLYDRYVSKHKAITIKKKY